MQSTRETSWKDSAAEQAVAQWEKDRSFQGQHFVIWNGEKNRKIRTKKRRALSSWGYNGASCAVVLQLIPARLQSAEINLLHQEKQPACDKAQSAAPLQGQQRLESLWLLSPLCQALFKALLAGGLLEGCRGDTGSGWCLSRGLCCCTCARHCAYYVVTSCMHAVTLASGFGLNTWEPSQPHQPTWCRRTSSKDQSHLLFQKSSKPKHSSKATEIHQLFQKAHHSHRQKRFLTSNDSLYGFLSTLNLRSPSHAPAAHLLWFMHALGLYRSWERDLK